MVRLLLFFALLLSSPFLRAQLNTPLKGPGEIRGKIIDSTTRLPAEYATITVFENGSNKVITGATSDSLGNFQIQGLAAGAYKVLVESIGYKNYQLEDIIISKKNPAFVLGQVRLQNNTATLQNVVVTSKQKLIENRLDKMVFNAEADLTSQSGVATDILKKIPQVSVDADGNVQLAGTGGIRFLINGRPSSAFGSNVADVLQSIPASQIKSIEVITNPGAKYDAQGMGGIINIILKQNKLKGINGSVALTAGTRQQNGSLNVTVRKANFGINAFVSGNYRPPVDAPAASQRNSIDTTAGVSALLNQNGLNRFDRFGMESGLGFDWTFKEKNSFFGNIGYNKFGGSGSNIVNQDQQVNAISTGEILSHIFSQNNIQNNNNFHSVEASLGFKRNFSEDKDLEISANTSTGNRNNRNNNFQSYMPQDSVYYGINNYNAGKESETQLSVDYTQPVKKAVLLGVGGRITLTDIASNADVYSLQAASKTYAYDSSLSNYLDYHQQVYALYSELAFPVSDWFNAKIGARYERTELNSFYSNAQHQADNPGYNTFVPSIYFSKKIKENQNLKISYSKRIERPDYGDLNPFINTTDPKNITAGNPYLLPELGHRFELAYNIDFGNFGSFMATAFYRINQNDIQPYTVVYATLEIGDSIYTNVSVSTRENIGTEKNLGLNLFGDLHPNGKLNVRLNAFFFRRHILNTIDAGNSPVSFNYRTNINVTYLFSKTFVGEFFGNFNSARNEVQGKYPSFTTYSFALRKQFWNKKGSLALVANNFFSKYIKQETVLYGTNFTTNSLRKVPYRSIGLNFTWKFGKLDIKKEKETNLDMPALQ